MTGETTYDRQVGRCSIDAVGGDLGLALIRNGLVGPCGRLDRDAFYGAAAQAAPPYRGKTPGYCRPR